MLVETQAEEEVVAGDRVGDRHLERPADGARRGQGGHDGVSPTNGMPWRSTASRLIRRAAVFWVATSRT